MSKKITFWGSVKNFWMKYVDFRGVTRRAEYWWTVLFLAILMFVVLHVNSITFFSVVVAVLVIPYVAMCVRRFHDVGVRGFWYVVPALMFATWVAIRESMWGFLLRLQLMPLDMKLFLILFAIFTVATTVVFLMRGKNDVVLPHISFNGAVKNLFAGCLDVWGRTGRREYWYGCLFICIAAMIATCLSMGNMAAVNAIVIGMVVWFLAYALNIRRYRDAGLSGLLYAIPSAIIAMCAIIEIYVGGVILLPVWPASLIIAAGIFGVLNMIVGCLPSQKQGK